MWEHAEGTEGKGNMVAHRDDTADGWLEIITVGGSARKPIRGGDNDTQMVAEPITILHTWWGISEE